MNRYKEFVAALVLLFSVFVNAEISAVDVGYQILAAALKDNQYTTERIAVVHIGNGLKRKLATIGVSLNGSCSVIGVSGDAPKPIGDGSASDHILISCGGKHVLGLRLMLEAKLNKFHVIGFWSPRSSPL